MRRIYLLNLVTVTATFFAHPLFASTDLDKIAGAYAVKLSVPQTSQEQAREGQVSSSKDESSEFDTTVSPSSYPVPKKVAEELREEKTVIPIASNESQETVQMPPFFVNPISQTVRMVHERINQIQSPVQNHESPQTGKSQAPLVGQAGDAVSTR